MKGAKYIRDLPEHPPRTKLYQDEEGNFFAIMVVNPFAMQDVGIPLSLSHVHPESGAFHADKDGTLIDADGDPLNGLTPFASSDPETHAPRVLLTTSSHEEVLLELGYTLEG